jgi:hypothetical protein
MLATCVASSIESALKSTYRNKSSGNTAMQSGTKPENDDANIIEQRCWKKKRGKGKRTQMLFQCKYFQSNFPPGHYLIQ